MTETHIQLLIEAYFSQSLHVQDQEMNRPLGFCLITWKHEPEVTATVRVVAHLARSQQPWYAGCSLSLTSPAASHLYPGQVARSTCSQWDTRRRCGPKPSPHRPLCAPAPAHLTLQSSPNLLQQAQML